MIGERFSLDAFNERGRESDAARELTDALIGQCLFADYEG